MTAPRRCRLCGTAPVAPSRLRAHDFRCSRCRHSTPAARARNARYFQTAKRAEVRKRSNAKRIFIGRVYHSMGTSAEIVRRITAHIKERRREFVTRQQDGEEVEGTPASRIPPEAAV